MLDENHGVTNAQLSRVVGHIAAHPRAVNLVVALARSAAWYARQIQRRDRAGDSVSKSVRIP